MTPDTRQLNVERACPVCGANAYTIFAEERLDTEKITPFTFASRKQPEFMCFRLVRCSDCNLVYTPTTSDISSLAALYADAAFDSGQEEQCASETYMFELTPHLSFLKERNVAVDVGSGSGTLLPLLSKFGFQKVIGIEPSLAAINSAPAAIRSKIIAGMFEPNLLHGVNPNLICSFMTLEHVNEPDNFVNNAFNILEQGGMIAVVTHNWQGMLNRILGINSPIIDIEHLQLFNVGSLHRLLSNNGFKNIKIIAIRNKYPLSYWLRLMPLPLGLKEVIDAAFNKLSLSDRHLSMSVGNILAVGTKT